MFLTKIWSVLVTLFAVAVTAAFLLATPPAESQLQEAYHQQLDGAQGLVDSHLRMESRRRLDFFSTVGKDFKIVKYLKEAKGKDRATAKPIAEKLTSYLNVKLKSGKAAKIFSQKYTTVEFVDIDGKVWAQLGANEGRFGDSLRHNPGIKRALEQRVCSDNTVAKNGALYFMWSCPVRYVKDGQKVEHVGAVRAMKKIDDDFATSLLALIGESEAPEKPAASKGTKAKGSKAKGSKAKGSKAKGTKAKKKAKSRKLKVAIAFFMKQKLVARTGPSKLWAKVKGVYSKHKEMVDNPLIGRSPAVGLKDGDNRYLMVVGRLPGGASGGGNYWVILWRFPSRLGPWAFRSSKLPRSEQFKYLPMTLFVVLGVLALFITVFLNWFEGDRPIGKLLKQSRELSVGNLEKLDDTQFRGRMGSIARSINEGLELVADKVPSKPALHDKDLDSILSGPDTSDEDFSLATDEPDAGAKPTGSVLDGFGGPGSSGSAIPAAGPAAGAPPPPPDLPKVDAADENPMQPTPSGNFAFGMPSGTTPHTAPGLGPGGPPPPPPVPPVPPAGENAAWREVYDQFVATKKQCGESVDKLTFEAFSAKLDKNKQAVIEKTSCKDVAFRVYIKDGKAALKATPVND